MSSPLSAATASRTAYAIVAAHNIVQNRYLNEKGYVSGNLAVTAALVTIARLAGLSVRDMGLAPSRSGGMHSITRWAGPTTAAVALVALTRPETRTILQDERSLPAPFGSMIQRILARFPIGTALFEEVAFRGVLPALQGNTRRADALSASAFGLWHVIPTARALRGNPAAKDMTARKRATTIVAGCVATGVAGMALAEVRRITGSLFAPWLIHASFNTFSYLAGALAWRLTRSRS